MKWFKAIFRADAWRFWRDPRGLIGPVLAITATATLASAGLAVDVGHALAVKNQLQASTDAAALAGAQQIYSNIKNAISTATTYSGLSGDKNSVTSVTVSMASGYPQLKCFASLSNPCINTGVGAGTANGIVVKQTATVNTIFAKFVGVSTWTVSTTSTAAGSGGNGKPLNVMFVIDTTQSMTTADTTCSVSGATRLDCALAGVRQVLLALTSSADQVGLMVFPPLATATTSPAQTPTGHGYTAASIELANPCPHLSKSASNYPVDIPYSAAGTTVADYELISLAQGNSPVNYNTTTGNVTTLNNSNDLVTMAAGTAGTLGCGVYDIWARGTYYANAITAANTALANEGTANSQNVIILLSDGDANSSSGMGANPCAAGVTAATNAKNTGTWVYALAYGASTSGTCTSDTSYNGCTAMQAIGTDPVTGLPTRFYSDGIGSAACPNATAFTDLVQAFQALAYSLIPARLIPDNTT